MSKSVYDWSWKRANKKHFLVLTKDENRIATVRDKLYAPQCSCCCPEYNCCGPTRQELEIRHGFCYHAYIGGKKIGQYKTSTEAKIAVEQYLNISTKKQKIVQPKLSYVRGGSSSYEQILKYRK